MASNPAVTFIADRTDIHKSCKSLESLINTLNDYCEAASAVVQLQKKLAKALREIASLKVTGEIPGNAFSGCATVFEALSDIDNKFSKFADKEYDSISGEVKKWFKKLAKEEKGHDERIATANARIKQAGQIYEKKSKKNARDAMEEHSRYMNLISTLGPEISQEKYNHALDISQRNTTTIYTVAGTLSRLAEAEWMRSCECVKRFASTIGPLANWRVYCEGGWSGDMPRDLPEVDESQQQEQLSRQPQQLLSLPPSSSAVDLQQQQQQQPTANRQQLHTPQGSTGPESSNASDAPSIASHTPNDELSQDAATQGFANVGSRSPHRQVLRRDGPPPSSFEPPALGRSEAVDTGSVRSLSAFPSPPTHFPIPPMGLGSRSPLSPSPQSRTNSTGNIVFPSSSSQGTDDDHHHYQQQQQQNAGYQDKPYDTGPSRQLTSSPEQERSPIEDNKKQPVSPGREDEFGVLNRNVNGNGNGNGGDRYPTRAVDAAVRSKGLERNDTGTSNESYVAAMRNKYSNAQTTAPASLPPPKFTPGHKSQTSVTDLASRYEAVDSPTSSTSGRERAASPPLAQRRQSLPPLDMAIQSSGRSTEPAYLQSPPSAPLPRSTSATSVSPLSVHKEEDEATLRRNDELSQRERKLQELEASIQQREREIEQDRARTYNDRPVQPRERHTSFQQSRPVSYAQSSTSASPRPQIQHSFTGNDYLTPSDRNTSINSRSFPSTSNEHAPSCGCEACSASKYASQARPTSYDLRPPERPPTLRPEKPKGWIRRLSMDVGNAFSLDSKKGISNTSYGASMKTGGAGVFSLDGKKNVSTTTLSRAQEDGRFAGVRRSYEASGANRSVTNLGRR